MKERMFTSVMSYWFHAHECSYLPRDRHKTSGIMLSRLVKQALVARCVTNIQGGPKK